MNKTNKITLSVKEASAILGISCSNMYALIRDNKVPNIKLGQRYLVPTEALLLWIEQQTRGGCIQ